MSEDRMSLNDAELDRTLLDLGRHFPYPPTPSVARVVESRLEGAARPSRSPRLRLPRLRSLGLGALAVLLLAGTVLAASPSARAAVSEWLGIPGVRVMTGGESPPSVHPGGRWDLGRRVTLGGAQARVSFHILLPDLSGFSRPDEVYLDTFPPGGRVSLIYRARSGLPQTHEAGVGLLLTEFQATAGQVFFGKTGTIVGWRSIPQGIRVGAGRGYWIKGDHLTFIYRTVNGRQVWSRVRLAGNTLLWEHDGLTLRLESALPEPAALHLAASMR